MASVYKAHWPVHHEYTSFLPVGGSGAHVCIARYTFLSMQRHRLERFMCDWNFSCSTVYHCAAAL